MGTVTQSCVWWPGLVESPGVPHDEALILKGPQPVTMRPLPVGEVSQGKPPAGAPQPPVVPATKERIEVVRTATAWSRQPFRPPTALYKNADVEIEHQDLHGRQPFYHRNTEVDEISYQVSGVRQLITDIGTVDLEPGDFVRIPVGVVHDNWCREDIHLLFYVVAPVEFVGPAEKTSTVHEFRAWAPAVVPERVSARGGAFTVLVDEKDLLSGAAWDPRKLEVAHVPQSPATSGSRWIYRSTALWLGQAQSLRDAGTAYRRNLNFDEVQVQLNGTRTLVTELGCVELAAGDFARIPAGIAYASINGACSYLRVCSAKPLERTVEATAFSEILSPEHIRALRERQD